MYGRLSSDFRFSSDKVPIDVQMTYSSAASDMRSDINDNRHFMHLTVRFLPTKMIPHLDHFGMLQSLR